MHHHPDRTLLVTSILALGFGAGVTSCSDESTPGDTTTTSHVEPTATTTTPAVATLPVVIDD